MTPLQAFQILDQLAGMVALKRQDWLNVNAALAVLQKFVTENTNSDDLNIQSQQHVEQVDFSKEEN